MGSSSFTIEPPPSSSGGFTVEPPAQQQPRTWMDSATDVAKGIWEKMNPVTGIHGAAQLAAHPIDAYTADAAQRTELLNKAEDAFKKGNYSEGMAHALYGIIPFLGTQADQAGTNIQQGNVAKGVGQSIGMGLNLSTPALLRGAGAALDATGITNAADSVASRFYRSALKPSTTLSTGKVADLVQTGLENKIPVSAGGLAKVSDLMDSLNQKIAAEIQSRPLQTINKYNVASRLSQTAQRFGTQVNPEADLNAVSKSGNEFLESQPTDIPATEAQALKQGTYQQLSNRAYGELGTATVESQKALARGLKEELATAFPELSKLNAADSKLIGLDDALSRAVNRISNHQLLGIGTPLAAAGAKAVTGSTGLAAVAAMLKAVTEDPYVKSRLAIALSKGGTAAPAVATKLAAYSSALGNAANAQAPENQGTQ